MTILSQNQEKFMERKLFASFSIASPKTNLPLVTTVWAHFEDGKFYVISNKATAKWRYLKSGKTEVGLNIIDPNGWPYLSVNGYASIYFQDEKNNFWDIVLRIIKKYNSGTSVDQWLEKMKSASPNATRFLIEIVPENIYSTL